MINKIKDFLGFDIKEDKYSLAKDEKFGTISKEKLPDKWVKSTCGYCGVGCGLYIGIKNNRAVYTKGDDKHSVNMGSLCPKGLSEHQMIEAKNRVLNPKIKKDNKLIDVNWSEAFNYVSDKFKETQKLYGKNSIGVISTGQLLTEEFYALGKFVQLGLETTSYDGNTTLCMASAVSGYKESFGSDGPTGCYEDFEKADVIVLVGANIADNHPILKRHLNKNKKNPKIIVIDPRFSKTANMADIFVPLKATTDLALINGLCHIILKEGLEDKNYIEKYCNNYSEFKQHLEKYTPKEVSDITGIDKKTLYEISKIYADADSAMIAWTMGINQSYLGTNSVSAMCNLALITGNIGKEGASAFSITGQCNAMGSRENSFTSSIPGYRKYESLNDREEYANLVNIPVELIPTKRGYKYSEIIEAIERDELKALWVIATNPLVSFPNQKRLRDAFKKLDILVVQDAFMSDTAKIADVVFSAGTWGEKEGVYTNSERRCSKANKAVEPIGNSKSDLNIILEFSEYFDKRELLFKDWKKPEDAFKEFQKVSSGRLCDYSAMSYESIEENGGIQWPCNEDNPNGTKRLYSDGVFQTKNKKANLICANWVAMSEDISKEFPIMLNTGRTVEQWHTRTKTGSIDILNDLAPEAWVNISPIDAKELKVKSGDRLNISSPRGEVKNIIVKVTNTVAKGNIFVPFHFNTSLVNTLTQSLFDPISGEPNFKQTFVKIYKKE